MVFIDRETELAELENLSRLSRERLFTAVIYGPRRVGKTELVKQAVKGRPRHLYFFVYEGKTKESLLKEFENELKAKGYIENEVQIADMDSFIRLLFKACEGAEIIFDEVQFMQAIYPAFFSVLQREIDENQDKKMHFIFLGSIVGLMKRVFEETKAPLYGRIKSSINLKPLTYRSAKRFLKHLKCRSEEDIVRFYSIFGGFPKYYAAMEDYGLDGRDFNEAVRYLFFRENAPLRNEVLSVLRQEFGAGKSYYYNILEAIATGHTKLSEIASYMSRSPTAIMPFVDDLLNYYEIIERFAPVTEKTPKRNTVYLIKNPLFRFWFGYVYPNLGYFEEGDYDYVMRGFAQTSNSFFGLGFEGVCREVLREMNGKKSPGLPFPFHRLGAQWGKLPGGNTFEMDIAALNEQTGEVLFCECKWRDLKLADARKILGELKEKAKFVQWRNDDRKEYFGIMAKKLEGKTELRKAGFVAIDLADF